VLGVNDESGLHNPACVIDRALMRGLAGTDLVMKMEYLVSTVLCVQGTEDGVSLSVMLTRMLQCSFFVGCDATLLPCQWGFKVYPNVTVGLANPVL